MQIVSKRMNDVGSQRHSGLFSQIQSALRTMAHYNSTHLSLPIQGKETRSPVKAWTHKETQAPPGELQVSSRISHKTKSSRITARPRFREQLLGFLALDKEQLQQKLKCGPPGASMPIQPLANFPFRGVLNSGSYIFKSFCENLRRILWHDRKARHIRDGKLVTLWHSDYCIVVREAEGEFLQGKQGSTKPNEGRHFTLNPA